MMKIVLWIAAACAILLAALALSRGIDLTSEPEAPKTVEVRAADAEEAATPAVAAAPAPEPAPAPPPVDDQVAEDAAAVGMTTVEPEPSTAPATPSTDVGP
jgi:hypothetical protein